MLLLILNTILICSQSVSLNAKSDSVFVEINAYNLSEDVSVLSTKNDEIIFQIYEKKSGDSVLLEPIISKMFLFDEANRFQKFGFDRDIISSENQYLIFIIEWDYERPKEQRNPVIRFYHREIESLYLKNEKEGLKRYLATDDLLGYQNLSGKELLNGFEREYSGVHKIDKYRYYIKMR